MMLTGTGSDHEREARTSSLAADPSRITEMLEALSAIGGRGRGAVTRLGYTAEEREAHQLVAGWLGELGLTSGVDAVGNLIAVREGEGHGLPSIAVGSHLDSVPYGGRFDGVVGVVGAVELMRVLSESKVTTAHPLRAVVFACEEGARFGEPCVGSKLVVGHLGESDLPRLRDSAGVGLDEAMKAVGLDPSHVSDAAWRPDEIAAFIELHVEQGGVLEADRRSIGLVDVVSGSTRLAVTVSGQANHSGATPMTLRADALMAAAEIALALEQLASDPSHRGLRATVGRWNTWPNSITTIPGRVAFTVDLRDTDGDRQRRAATEAVERARWICDRRGVQLEWTVIADTSPTVLTMWLREELRRVCGELGIAHRVLTSGASHDAQIVSTLVPSAIVFVPSRDGVSHVPAEWTSASDIARGVEVVAETVLRLDDFLLATKRERDRGAG